MPTAIKQVVTVESAGVLEVRSPELHAGDRAEVTVVVIPQLNQPTVPAPSGAGDWRRYAGAVRSGDPNAGDNQSIDAALADEYQHGSSAKAKP
jgi:hypothetical protein